MNRPPTEERRPVQGTNPDDAANHLHTATDLDDGETQRTADHGQDRDRHALSDQDRERLAEFVEHARQHLRVSWTPVVTLAEVDEPEDYAGRPAGSPEWLEPALQWAVERATADDAPDYLLEPFRLDEDGFEVTASPTDEGLLAAAAYSLVSAAVLQDAAHLAVAEAVAALRVRQVGR